MKKFKFKLESVLKIKTMYAEQARRDYVVLQNKIKEEMGVLYNIYEKIENSYQLALDYKMEGSQLDPKLEGVDLHIWAKKKEIEAKSDEIRKLKQELEKKELIWQEREKEKKSLEKIKENELIKYKKYLGKIEQKQTDDLVSVRFKR